MYIKNFPVNRTEEGQTEDHLKETVESSLDSSWMFVPLERPEGLGLKSNVVNTQESRLEHFLNLLSAKYVNIEELRDLSWHGIPSSVRPTCWGLLLGYLSASQEERTDEVPEKREAYHSLKQKHYYSSELLLPKHQETLQQIRLDVPRTIGNEVLRDEIAQQMMERLLYIWSAEHSSIEYFQGLGDALAPFLTVFLCAKFEEGAFDGKVLSPLDLWEIEADIFWCFSLAFGQLEELFFKNNLFGGVEEMLTWMRLSVKREDEELFSHMESESVEYVQFAFRWMLCLLTRELNPSAVVRLWDSYLSMENFAYFHVSVCTAFLLHWRDHLVKGDFAEQLIFLQHPPTHQWGDEEISSLLEKGNAIYERDGELVESFMSLSLAVEASHLVALHLSLGQLALSAKQEELC